MQPGGCVLRPGPKFGRELDLPPSLAIRMKNRTPRDRRLKHFLQAKGLGAELDIVILPLPPFARIDFPRPTAGEASRLEI